VLSRITPGGVRSPIFNFAASTLPVDFAIVPLACSPVGDAWALVDKLAVLAAYVGLVVIAVMITVLMVISPRKRSETERW